MKNEEDFFTGSGKALEEYIQTRLFLFKLQSVEKASRIIAVVFSGLLVALLGFFILLFISIMAGYYFASLTGSLYLGFGIVAGTYILLLVVLISIRKKLLEKYVANTVIEIFFEKNEDEHDTTNSNGQ